MKFTKLLLPTHILLTNLLYRNAIISPRLCLSPSSFVSHSLSTNTYVRHFSMNNNTTSLSKTSSSTWDIHRIRGIVFDMDGTLTNQGAIDFQAMRTRCNVPPGQDMLDYIAKLEDKNEQLRCHQILEEEEKLGLERMIFADGAYTLLSYLQQQNIPRALLTRNNEYIMKETMKLLFEKYRIPNNNNNSKSMIRKEDIIMNEIIQENNELLYPMLSRSFLPCKPHPAPLHHIANLWGITSYDILMVGDSIDDMMCGKAAGSQTCLIGTNINCPIYQKALPYADITITSLSELQFLWTNKTNN